MSPFKINRPRSGGGDKWDKGAHIDHLHVFIANDGFTAENVDTSNGPADAVKVDTIVCIHDLEVWRDQLVFGKALVPRLDNGDPGVTVGRLGQGLAGPGKNPPWTLDDPTDGDIETAEQFLERYATTLGSGVIVLDERAITADRDKPEEDPL